mmetsp:Transcript_14100/g.39903  ORF Transcript_14100/g.39903 Transcript_14100/m.39903 type:complete len:256 (+) Transcript_14100:1065-1832(+)
MPRPPVPVVPSGLLPLWQASGPPDLEGGVLPAVLERVPRLRHRGLPVSPVILGLRAGVPRVALQSRGARRRRRRRLPGPQIHVRPGHVRFDPRLHVLRGFLRDLALLARLLPPRRDGGFRDIPKVVRLHHARPRGLLPEQVRVVLRHLFQSNNRACGQSDRSATLLRLCRRPHPRKRARAPPAFPYAASKRSTRSPAPLLPSSRPEHSPHPRRETGREVPRPGPVRLDVPSPPTPLAPPFASAVTGNVCSPPLSG